MSASKLDVLWSPVHHDKFIIWGTDLTLYEVALLSEIEKKSTFIQISPTRGATAVASQSATTVRCVDISAIPEQPDPLLALGHTNGKVTLSSLKHTYDPLELVGREFVPKYQRVCNSVSWSRVETNLLASAMEKHRSDHCILLWDVNRTVSTEGTEATFVPSEPSKPIAEMGLSETAHSVAWNNCNRTLVASMNSKHIKIFDLREMCKKGVGVATSRHCLGACADPWSAWLVASRGEACVCVWDARALHRPLLVLPQPRPVTHLRWSPTRRNLLISLQRDSNSIRLHDIQQTEDSKNAQQLDDNLMCGAVEAELEEQYSRTAHALERDATPAPGAPLAAAACHPALQGHLLVLSTSGTVSEYTISERVTVNWGAGGGLVWAGGPSLRLMREDFYAAIKDISYVMKRRAQTDYGLKPDLWQNADLADDDELSNAWHFLALSKSLVEDGCIRNSPLKHPGVRTVLRMGAGVGGAGGEGGYRSEAVVSLVADVQPQPRRVTVYRSAERSRALQLCGWGWGWENAAAGVERAEAEGAPCRAAAIAAFHLRVRTALDVLARAQEPQLRVAALALAGLSDEAPWRAALAAATPALPDAYLRALLRFLAATAGPAQEAAPPALAAVLAETEMRLEDRVAFACLYLPDAALHEYVRRLGEELTAQGALAGLVVVGAGAEGAALLQRWVERTGDVQSAALLAARAFPPGPEAEGARLWASAYRGALDAWRLWGARARLDAWLLVAGGEAPAPRHVTAACTYCGKGVAAPPAPARPRALARLPPPAKMKQLSACPHCRKPLPRCAVCALHVGTPAAARAAAHFAGWFSWCVACRHGGHASHLLDWFKEHTECPVSSCSCRCITLDRPDELFTKDASY